MRETLVHRVQLQSTRFQAQGLRRASDEFAGAYATHPSSRAYADFASKALALCIDARNPFAETRSVIEDRELLASLRPQRASALPVDSL